MSMASPRWICDVETGAVDASVMQSYMLDKPKISSPHSREVKAQELNLNRRSVRLLRLCSEDFGPRDNEGTRRLKPEVRRQLGIGTFEPV